MKKTDYAWNAHEQSQFGKGLISRAPKIKIFDDAELRQTLAFDLEKLPQNLLAEWTLENAEPFLSYLDAPFMEDQRIKLAKEALKERLAGNLSAAELRKAGFLANQLAKEATTEIGKAAARVFAQAIAVGHMRGHALVSADYGVKTINLLYPHQLPPVSQLRQQQIASAHTFLKNYL
ncbi:putative immunity protein [Enterococcus sp. LJL90]